MTLLTFPAVEKSRAIHKDMAEVIDKSSVLLDLDIVFGFQHATIVGFFVEMN